MATEKERECDALAWSEGVVQAEWEAEIERDFSPGGAGMALLDEMKNDALAGKFRPFDEGRKRR